MLRAPFNEAVDDIYQKVRFLCKVTFVEGFNMCI